MGWIRRGVHDGCAWHARRPALLVLAVAGTLILGSMRFLSSQDREYEEFYRQLYRQNPSRDWAIADWLAGVSKNRGAAAAIEQARSLEADGVTGRSL